MARVPGNILRMKRADFEPLSDAQVEAVRKEAGLEADYGATYWRRMDGWRVLELAESVQSRRAGVREYKPADPGDVRFEVGERDEEGYCSVVMVDDQGTPVERHSIRYDEVGSFVGSFRECQGMSYAEAAEPFGALWQWEQEER